MRPFFIFISLVTLLLLSFSKPEEATYLHDGVNMTIPAKWKISKEAPQPDGGHFVSFQRKGLSNSGLVKLKWSPGELDLKKRAEAHRKQLQSAFEKRNANPEMGDLSPVAFGYHQGLSFPYQMALLGVKHEGEVVVFQACGKTFSYITQEAVEDHDKNQKGFEAFAASFSCTSK